MKLEAINKKLGSSKSFLVISFTLFTALMGIIGIGLYHYQQQSIIKTTNTKLSILGHLKANQIHYWRQEQMSRAQLLTSNPFLRQLIEKYLSTPNLATKQQIIANLAPVLGGNSTRAIILLDTNIQPLLQCGEEYMGPHFDLQTQQRIATTGHPSFSNIYNVGTDPKTAGSNTNSPKFRMNITAQLRSSDATNMSVLGSLVLVIDPNKFLLPLINAYASQSDSAESVLVRKRGNKVTPITPLRFNTNSVLSQVSPPKGVSSPGQYIIKDKEGLLSGYDYRQVKIFAAVKKVPDSSWSVVTKIDQAEALRPLTKISAIIFTTIMLIICAVGMIVWLWWRRQQAINRALHYEQELQNRTIITRFDNLTRNSNDIIILCDEKGNIIDGNDRALEAYGQSMDELRHHKLRSMCDMGDSECSILWQQLALKAKIKFDSLQFRRDGSNFPVEINASWIEVGQRRLLQAIIRDVSERKEAELLLRHQAQHDPLTGLPNRTLLTDRLHQSISNSKRQGHKIGLLCLDLDRFKNINDTLGHSNGDTLLTTMAQRIKQELRETDTVARFGGDEFMILLEDAGDISTIANLAIKLLATIGQPIVLANKEIYITTSIGISVGPDDSDQTDQLIRCTETALYRAKETGRNNFQFYTSDMNAYTSERLELETNLRQALANQEFIVYYQPQVDITSGRIVGSEALVRWQHPQRGLIPPNDFIPMAEETGLITAMGMWVLEQACRQNQQWHADGFTDLSVAVNLSPRQFNDPNLQQAVLQIIHQTGFDPHCLELEITESLSMDNVDSSILIMQAFTAAGISIAIDDFGTGFSSLSNLHLFPINKLKIDRSFISKISEDKKNTLVRSIVGLAKQLEIKVIAEGVETAEQLEILRQLHCNLVQGYYYGRPMPAGEFNKLLQQQPKAAPLPRR